MHNPEIFKELQNPCSLQRYLTLILCPALFSLLCLSIPLRPPQRFLSLDNVAFLFVLATVPAAIISSNYARNLMLLGLPRRPWTRVFPTCTVLSVSISSVTSNLLTMIVGTYPLPLNVLCTAIPCDIVFGSIGMFLTLRKQDQIIREQREREKPTVQILEGTAQASSTRFGRGERRSSVGLESHFQKPASRGRASYDNFVTKDHRGDGINETKTCLSSEDQERQKSCVWPDKEDVGGLICLDEQWTRGLPWDGQPEKKQIRLRSEDAAAHVCHTDRAEEEVKGGPTMISEQWKSGKAGHIEGAAQGDADGFEDRASIVLLDEHLPDKTKRNKTPGISIFDPKESVDMAKLAKNIRRAEPEDRYVEDIAQDQPEAAFKDRFKACARVTDVFLFYFVLCNACYVVTLTLGTHVLYVFLALEVCAITSMAVVRKAILSATQLCRQSSSRLICLQLYGRFTIQAMLDWYLLILMPSSGSWNAFGLAFFFKVGSFAFDCWAPSHAALRVTQKLRVFSPFPMYFIPTDVSCGNGQGLPNADVHQYTSPKGQQPSTPLATPDQSDDSDDGDVIVLTSPMTGRRSFVQWFTLSDPDSGAGAQTFKPLFDSDSEIGRSGVFKSPLALSANGADALLDAGLFPVMQGNNPFSTISACPADDGTGADHVSVRRDSHSEMSHDVVPVVPLALLSSGQAQRDAGHVLGNGFGDRWTGDVTGGDHIFVRRRQSTGQNPKGATCHRCGQRLGNDVTPGQRLVSEQGETCLVCGRLAEDDVTATTSSFGDVGKSRRHSSYVIRDQWRSDDASAVCRLRGHKAADDVTGSPRRLALLLTGPAAGRKDVGSAADGTAQALAESVVKSVSGRASAGLGRPRSPDRKDTDEQDWVRGRRKRHGAHDVASGVTSPSCHVRSHGVVDVKGPTTDATSSSDSDMLHLVSLPTNRDVIVDPPARDSGVTSPVPGMVPPVGHLASLVTPLTAASRPHHRRESRRATLGAAGLGNGPHPCPGCTTQVQRVVLGVHLFLRVLRQLALCVSQTILFSYLHWTGYNWSQWLPFPMEDGRMFVSLCLSCSVTVLYVLLFVLARHWQMRTFALDPFYWGSRYVASFDLELMITLAFVIIVPFGVTCPHYNVFQYFFKK